MGDTRMDGPNTPPIRSATETLARFLVELSAELPEWSRRLHAAPRQLDLLEREVHKFFARGADMIIVGLMAVVMKTEQLDRATFRTRDNFAYPLEAGRKRTIQVRLLGGLVIWFTSLYCAPRKSWMRRQVADAAGVYPELLQFGIGKRSSPGLESRVARKAALYPSLEFAKQELVRDGLQIDVKTVRRVAQQCGVGLLQLRKQELDLWRAGNLPAGTELAGKRVSVQLDGGRTRIRGEMRQVVAKMETPDADGLLHENAPGRSRKRPTMTFDADWREPKLLTIFVHDAQGRMEQKTQATIDGTFQGPDAIAEIAAMHLHRLGAAKASSITFVADGGVWIWDRLPAIARLANLETVPQYQVLDCCHAAHHVSLALAALGYNDQQRMPLYREHRTLLRNGQWRQVVAELTELAQEAADDAKVWTEIAYLRKHGEAGRLKYPTFRGLGLPLGSGAIESNIRRVVNMRLKSNATFWREENAEAMMQVRAQVLTDRWDERLTELRNLRGSDARAAWHWSPQDMTSTPEHAPPQLK